MQHGRTVCGCVGVWVCVQGWVSNPPEMMRYMHRNQNGGFFFHLFTPLFPCVCVCVFEREMHPPVSGKTTVSEQRGQLSFLAAVLISQEGRVKADNRFQISAWWIFPLCFHLFYLLFLHRQSTSKQ